MSKGPWHDGRRAWQRLEQWHPEQLHPDDADSALAALADIGLIRRLLDQAELVAVRTARRGGRSWAEIATQLGVTRQSAWERWRELDDVGHELDDVADSAISTAAAEAVSLVAREHRRQSSVKVPNVVGMSWNDARDALHRAHLVAVGPDPDGPPLAAFGWPDGVVTDQSPEAGAKVPSGSPVTVWLDRGGGSGVREPRRPKPAPRTGRAMREESDEAIG